MSARRPIALTAAFTLFFTPAFALEDSEAKSGVTATIAAMETQAVSWGAMLRDAKQLAGCKPSSKAWLHAVSESVQSEMDAAIAQLRQLSSDDRAEFAAHEQQIRTWVAGQATQAGGSTCKS